MHSFALLFDSLVRQVGHGRRLPICIAFGLLAAHAGCITNERGVVHGGGRYVFHIVTNSLENRPDSLPPYEVLTERLRWKSGSSSDPWNENRKVVHTEVQSLRGESFTVELPSMKDSDRLNFVCGPCPIDLTAQTVECIRVIVDVPGFRPVAVYPEGNPLFRVPASMLQELNRHASGRFGPAVARINADGVTEYALLQFDVKPTGEVAVELPVESLPPTDDSGGNTKESRNRRAVRLDQLIENLRVVVAHRVQLGNDTRA